MRALTGVGPSMASGSHVWSGNCADFATAPPSRPSATRVATVELYSPPRMPNSSEPAFLISRKSASAIVASPIAAAKKAFIMNAIGDATMALEPDQQVRREADHAPAREQEQQVAALDEQEHREDEQRHVGEVAALLVVAVHVADRVSDDQRSDAGDNQHHEDGERVDHDLEAGSVGAAGDPCPRRRDDAALFAVASEQPDEGRDGAAEGHEARQRREVARAAAGDALSGERDQSCGRERREEADPGAVDHRGLATEGTEPVDVERDALPVERDDQAEADDDLGGRDGHHREREDLPVAVVQVAREGDQ